jgi:peptide-methionine (S)-S-oxide reductase
METVSRRRFPRVSSPHCSEWAASGARSGSSGSCRAFGRRRVGYAGGITLNPTYQEVCSGNTGHAEVVRIVFDPKRISYADLLKAFWESHDPTQGMRQGGDVGTQYRSAIYALGERQLEEAKASKAAYQRALASAGHRGAITTEIQPAPQYFYAEDYHQQYLAKNPDGYCGIGGTGVACPAGLGTVLQAAG